jgi:hypothetical protein
MGVGRKSSGWAVPGRAPHRTWDFAPQTPLRSAPCGDAPRGTQSGTWDFAPQSERDLRQLKIVRPPVIPFRYRLSNLLLGSFLQPGGLHIQRQLPAVVWCCLVFTCVFSYETRPLAARVFQDPLPESKKTHEGHALFRRPLCALFSGPLC